ncbi:hypothetical protein BDV17DRAFT_15514 [Aspergillus undulatus]
MDWSQLEGSVAIIHKQPDRRRYFTCCCCSYFTIQLSLAHTTTGCGEQGFPSAQPYLSHTPAG